MLSILTLFLPISSIFLGFEITLSFTRLKFRFVELIGSAFPVGMAISSFLALCLNPILHCNTVHFYTIVFISMLISMILFMLNFKIHNRIQMPKSSTLIWIALCELSLIYISYSAYISENGKMIQSGENDLFLEISYISSFSHGINNNRGFTNNVMLPLVSGSIAKSEFLPSIYLSLMNVNGMPIQWSIFIITSLLLFSIALLQYSFTYRLCQNEYASALSIPVVFLSGGFGFFHFLKTRDRTDPSVDYVFYLGSEIVNSWGHPMLHCILTSRAVELSMSLSILCFILLEAESPILSILLTYIILVIRPQTAVAVGFISIFYKFKLKEILSKSICLIPIFFILPAFDINVKRESALYWIDSNRKAMFPFISYPISIFGVLFFSLFFSIFEFKEKFVTSLISFYLLTTFSFQPNLRFNFFTILSTIVPIFISISFSGMINFAKRWKSNPDVQGTCYSLIFFSMIFMCLSSFTGIYARYKQKFNCWDSQDIDLGNWIINNTKLNDVFVGDSLRFWNPATSIAGRPLYVGNLHWMQCTPFHNGNREEIFQQFIEQGTPINDVNYYVVQKSGNWAQKAKGLIGVKYLIEYENEKYFLLVFKHEQEQDDDENDKL